MCFAQLINLRRRCLGPEQQAAGLAVECVLLTNQGLGAVEEDSRGDGGKYVVQKLDLYKEGARDRTAGWGASGICQKPGL